MSKRWQVSDKNIFIRDLIRDYCKVHTVLNEQSARFAHSGTISYVVLRDLLGDSIYRGIFWSLKDSAHHLLRMPLTLDNEGVHQSNCKAKPNKPHALLKTAMQHEDQSQGDMVVNMLDWCVGYAFHECVKLKEDAFQRQHYTNRFLQFKTDDKKHAEILEGLLPFTQQTHESMAREIERILGVFAHIGKLFIMLLENHKNNQHIARLLVNEMDLVQAGFGIQFEKLLKVLYDDTPAKRYLLAMQLALDCGRKEQAVEIINKASVENAPHDIVKMMRELLDKNMESSS